VTVDQVTTVLVTLAWAGVVLLVAVGVLSVTPAGRMRLHALLSGQGVSFGWLVATVATAGSLYLSEVAEFVPCTLCWYQRIAMYPLVLILGFAALRRDRGIRWYGIALAGVGASLSTWHILVEAFPDTELGGGCDPANPCTIRWIDKAGFTIPRMALVAFLLVVAALALDKRPGIIEEP
jgi:disulfide bond formation protein DsbB